MSDHGALIFGALMVGLLLLDTVLLQTGATMFLVLKLSDLVEYLTFWR